MNGNGIPDKEKVLDREGVPDGLRQRHSSRRGHSNNTFLNDFEDVF